MKPIIVVTGRPNVGKSTFFNRITKTKDAIVDNLPGVTRDRNFKDASYNGSDFILVDTGGFEDTDKKPFSKEISQQIFLSLKEADIIIFILDRKSGPTLYDAEFLHFLRAEKKPIFYAVNKIDSLEQEKHLYDFYSLGADKLYPVSAEHGYGIPDMLDDIISLFPKQDKRTEKENNAPKTIKAAFIGKPNAGKSSLINRILQEDRVMVSDIPGTTRDTVDIQFSINRDEYILIDTAGIRRKKNVSAKLEKFSIIKALKSLERCDIALIIIDAEDGVSEQDIKIAGYAHQRGCGCIFLLNKWDLIEANRKIEQQFYETVQNAAKFLRYAPIMTISALTGLRVKKIFKEVKEVFAQYSERISSGVLNRIIERAIEYNEPSLHKGKRLKFYYTVQVSTKPPEFIFFVNYPDGVHFSYKRYLENRIRKDAGLDKTPLKLFFKQRSGRIRFGTKKKRDGKIVKSVKRL
ncbi:MAG: ribosome biogenesis GTPase Der [Deltaproteobacteria bacterium]|nr:ribosome biogenesis GTPase Der [Deltaproteobacteria bacterium]